MSVADDRMPLPGVDRPHDQAEARWLRLATVARCVRCGWEGRSSDVQVALGAYRQHKCEPGDQRYLAESETYMAQSDRERAARERGDG